MAGAPVLELEGLRKRYRVRDPWAVDGVTLRLEAGTVFGLLGPNGAGKTTIVKMVAGLLRPNQGRVLLFGRDPLEAAARVQLGFAPEDPDFPKFLAAPEVLDYLGRLAGLSATERGQRIPEVLEWAGLQGERRQVRHFSKGMKQRLGLAQAILNRPRLLILDEPTADLDPLGRRDVRELIVRLRDGGATVLLNSHLLSEVERVCDEVAILNRGRLLKQGPLDEVVPEGKDLEQVFIELLGEAGEAEHLPSFLKESGL